ncbi:hypothetical protein NQ317_007187 [Molorchus minor]|uniref:Dynein regulatory complex subunit 2 n=1 Tax=Molorchus minor TaxID=1323400 RepID=A0ABQ9J6W8_9CUCU|nr:hypothetical protein NQ317_007187 [Molorchus minor]
MAPPLTPEEKKALKAAKKEQKKRLKIEADKQLKRDYLGREVKYGQFTIKRHEREWKKMLAEIALPKMREDLEFAWHNFERVVDCKDFTISLLMDEVKEAEEQNMVNIRKHLENIDKLMELFREQTEELRKDYEAEITKLKENSAEDIKKLNLVAEEEEYCIKTMLYILDIARKETKQNLRSEYFSKLGDHGKIYHQTVNRLKGVLENKFRYLLKDTTQFVNQYDQQTKERNKEYNELNAQDDCVQKLLVIQLEKIRKACEHLKILKIKLNDSQKLLGRIFKDASDSNDFFDYAFSTLKRKLEDDMTKDSEQMIHLTVNSHLTLEHLENLKLKGERTLSIGAVCRKLETQKEKVKPFPARYSRDYELGIEHIKEYLPQLDLFWQKVAQTEASRCAINEEKEFLKVENDFLKAKLYEYCQCISCPVSEKNIISQSVKHITEGALEQKKYEKQNFNQFASSGANYDIDY